MFELNSVSSRLKYLNRKRLIRKSSYPIDQIFSIAKGIMNYGWNRCNHSFKQVYVFIGSKSWIYSSFNQTIHMNTKPNSKIITVYAQISAIGTPKIQTKRVKMMRLNCSITNNKIIHNYDFTNTKFTLILWRIPPVATGYLFSIANFSLKHKIKTEFFPAVLYL